VKILISRTDSIGDVILTLPLCGWIKKNIPDAEVHFLCQKLTVDIIKQSTNVDHIHVWDGVLPDVDAIIHVFPNKEIAKRAKAQKIKIRIGTSHRLVHIFKCNRLVNFTRVKSELHESQLNFKLLKGLKIETIPSVSEISGLIGWKTSTFETPILSKEKFNLIFHIKSRGSAKEWKASNYLELAKQLPKEKFNIILTGTEAEGELIRKEIPEIFSIEGITDTTGQLSLLELINLIGVANGLLACSTGPLHIAGVSEIKALGLYPQQKPMHIGRWGPLGKNSFAIEEMEESSDKYLKIDVGDVKDRIKSWL
jgi:heptosyltransferase III